MNRKSGKIIFFLILTAAMVALFLIFSKSEKKSQPKIKNIPQIQQETGKVPDKENKVEENAPEPAKEEQKIPKEQEAENIPEKYILEMPFYSQAPLSEWDEFHEDMCEEASVLNAAYYLLDKKPSKEEYEKELQKMQNVEKKVVGEWKSTTVAQTMKVIEVYFDGKIKSKIIENPTIEDIGAEIAAGNPVVVPLAGRDIGNPNFTPPGPVYHMLTIKGYDSHNFITNDVGTRKGNSYAYKKEVIMKNIHDWNAKDIHLGGKKAIVLYK